MSEQIMNQMLEGMDKGIHALQRDLAKLRTGRASSALVDSIQVEYYGSNVPLNQVANVTTPDARTIQIAPWEQNMLGAVEKSILAANIGLTPQNDGKLIRIPLPPLTEERRKEMVKTVRRMGEDAKIAIRNHRRDANDEIKKLEKDKTISEDDSKKEMEKIQKVTDSKTKEVDVLIESKEKEILTV
ncbi:MAG: ribosome recycling factor [Bdellovibrionaceae bacterium]|nr:ribosome recycling factor [Pseudobdellovibrionaceae bacterium]